MRIFSGTINLTYDVSDGSASTSASGSINVTGVADQPNLTVSLGDALPGDDDGETITINANNFTDTDSGFTVSAQIINEDGSLTETSTDNVTEHRGGFGASGDNTGPAGQVGYDNSEGISETLQIAFDDTVSEAQVTIGQLYDNENGWQAHETGEYALYRDGELVGSGSFEGNSNDEANLTLTADDGLGFDTVVFSAGDTFADGSTSRYGASDFNIETVTATTMGGDDDGATYPLNIAAALTDTDGSETLTLMVGDLPEGVTLSAGTENPDGTWTLTSADLNGLTVTVPEGVEADFPLTVTATSSENNTSAEASVTVTVPGNEVPNTGPEADDVDLGSMAEDGSLTISAADLLANSSDADGDDLSVTAVTVDAQYGSITENGEGGWTFTPAENFSGQDVPISFTVSDGEATDSAIAVIDVTGVADAGTAVTQDETGTEDRWLQLNLDSEASADTDGSETVTISITDVPEGARLSPGSDQGDGTWTVSPQQLPSVCILPPANFAGAMTMTLNVITTEADGHSTTNSSSFTVDVAPDADGVRLTVDDEVTATGGGDGIQAAAGDADIVGTSGNDRLSGGNSSETIVGNGGNDSITGSGGDDVIYGDGMTSGNGTVTANLDVQASLPDSDGSEVATIVISGLPEGASLNAGTDNGNGSYTLTVDDLQGLQVTAPESAGDFDLSVAAHSTDTNPDSGATDTSGTSTATISVNVGGGEDGRDTIKAGTGDDTVYGGGGNDNIKGEAGDDLLVGGAGNDSLRGGSDHDELQGGEGNDVLRGDSGQDVLSGGSGNDNLKGGTGHDTLMGDDGNDKLKGEDGEDILAGGSGSDSLNAGSGHDFIYAGDRDTNQMDDVDKDTIVAGHGEDHIYLGGGGDTVNAGSGHDEVQLDVASSAAVDGTSINGSSGTDTLRVNLDGAMTNLNTVLAELGAIKEVLDNSNTNDFSIESLGVTAKDVEELEIYVNGERHEFAPVADGDETVTGNSDQLAAGLSIFPGFDVEDVDSDSLMMAVIDIAGGYRSGDALSASADLLSAAGVNIDSAGLVDGTDTYRMVLSGDASIAEYEAIIASVKLVNDGTSLGDGDRTITAKVTDDQGNDSNLHTVNVAVSLPGGDQELVSSGGDHADVVYVSELDDGEVEVADVKNGDLERDVDMWQVQANGASGVLGEDDLGEEFSGVDAGDGEDWVIADTDEGVEVDLGGDTLTHFEHAIGTEEDDVLKGNDEANILAGGDGDDTLISTGDNDLLLGGDGEDTFEVQADDLTSGNFGGAQEFDREVAEALADAGALDAGETDLSNFQKSGLDGGAGDDTLRVISEGGGSVNLDHDAVSGVQNVEVLDLTGVEGSVNASLSVEDLISMTDDDNSLTILHDENAVINVDGQDVSSPNTYTFNLDGQEVELTVQTAPDQS